MSAAATRTDPKKLIMVVDDDTDIRALIASALVQEGYSVIEAKDGRLASAMLAKQWPDAIISDIKMPHIDGLMLLEEVRKVSTTPFILMTGFSEVLETQEAVRRGATDFILKPFKRQEMLALLDLAFSKEPVAQNQAGQEAEANEMLDLGYCRLSIDEFISGKMSLADVFVRITEKKYIKVARKNSELSLDRINIYRDKGLHFLYIRKEEFSGYLGLNIALTTRASAKGAVSKNQRMRLMKHTSEMLLQDAYVNGVQKEKLQASSALVESMVSALSDDKELSELLSILQAHADYLYSHSLGVALYATMIAEELGWSSGPTLLKVAMGGLFHDIGKKEIPRNVLEKPRQNLTSAERALYETHPIRGKELLGLIKSVPDDVVQITMHHHENGTGRGFPYHLLKSKIHPLAKLVSVANEFCDLAIKAPGYDDPLTAHEAIKKLYVLHTQELDPTYLRGLMILFNYPIPDDMPKPAALPMG